MNPEVKKSIEESVLCWLATSTPSGEPNVSPKEVFSPYGDHHIIVANIASPNTVKNILSNANVCISFIDIFVQKGFQIKGKARIVKEDSV
ncbi:MAG: pyridoxamine 5'-phosphate oxidase family protein, partial [Bacteroidota bacterium]